jgi:DNA-binding HxlR family transcriptional regulator
MSTGLPSGSVSARRTYGQPCPVAAALDVVGERWTLLIVRDLMFGALRFSDLRDGLSGLAPNLLSERLKMLVAHGIVEQVELPPPAARTVYALTVGVGSWDRSFTVSPASASTTGRTPIRHRRRRSSSGAHCSR